MDVDPDVADLVSNLQTALEAVQEKVQQPFLLLDEDIVASSFSVDEQARLSLAAAFTMIMAFYCHKRLQNETIDAQLKLKVERVSDYVKKLRELVEREKVKGAAAPAGAEPPLKRSRIDKDLTKRLVQNAQSVNERSVRTSETAPV